VETAAAVFPGAAVEKTIRLRFLYFWRGTVPNPNFHLPISKHTLAQVSHVYVWHFGYIGIIFIKGISICGFALVQFIVIITQECYTIG
jgi:hypothetical protein